MTDTPAPDADAHPADADAHSADYVVVARRYRPQTFEELIGQQHVSQALTRAIANERVGHAYLFTGARGVGKTSAARILAKALNCAQGTSPTPCNACELCQSVSTGDDVDVLEIDGASNRGIDEIRQLRQNVAVRPSRARFKIYIIDEVHMLTKEAFNALLKTLEEPPEHVKFIFATTEPNKIPVTILSRCQRYDFAGIEATEIQTRLKQIAECEGVTVEDDAVQILAMRAAGSMRDSQSLLEQLLSTGADSITAANVTAMLGIAPAARLSRLISPLVERNAAEALTEFAAAISEGAEVSQLVDQLLGYFRDGMTQAVGCDPARMLYALPGQREEVGRIAEKLGVQTLLAIVQVLDQTAARMRVSTHTRTLAEMALVRICHLENLDELAALIAQVKDLPGEASPPATAKKNVTSSPSVSRAQHASGTPSPGEPISTPGATTQPLLEPHTATVLEEETSALPTPLSPDNAEVVWKRTLDSLSGLLMDHAAEADEVAVDAQGRLVL
ncbi:MAG: DNA polymerase III subunit gamma/tau, partial [Pirellulales bacterium]|nr:DNA polymerase III subunit gamma/tau [Pirellulales bacterium]